MKQKSNSGGKKKTHNGGKQKSHSGLKKRVKVRKSGTVSVQKSCKNHLLDNKSKGQKKLHKSGMPLEKTKVKAIRKLLPGKF